jgi:murein DD-endopeptidase MepM/ murein hydrolase activator NlpD
MRFSAFLFISLFPFSMPLHEARYPDGQFVSPVNRQFQLSGTFGELRTNHFHAGLDIKSRNGTIGDTVYAAGSGYISRISVDAFGYGNAIFIDHPNGFTTVYGHLDRFSPVLQEYVKQEQYKREESEVDLYPAPFQFPVQQSDEIGILGNTGHSVRPSFAF